MAENLALEVIDRQEWLDPVADDVKQVVSKTFSVAGPAGRKVKNFLHGTWLGHPLHPVLTDVPIGAWTAALVFDVLDDGRRRSKMPAASEAAIAVGLAGAAGAAVTGITDWSETDGRARRIGLSHGLLNLTGVMLFATSLALRRSGMKTAGRAVSLLGYAVAAGAAYLGGSLVYSEQIGVDHTKGAEPPRDFVPVLAEWELADNQPRRVEANGYRVLLVRHAGEIRAIAETCSHLGGPLAEGTLEGDTVRCPWHGSCFSLEDGSVIDGPATHSQPRFETRVRNGQIEVRAAE